MKTYKFKFLVMFCLAALFVLGCKKPTVLNVSPTLEFVADTGYISTDTLWAAGDTAIIGLRCISNGTNAVRTIFVYYNDKQLGNPIEIDVAKGQDFTYELKITKSLLFVEKYYFEVMDSRGNVSNAKLTIRIDETGGDIKTVSTLLGAQNNPSIGSFFGFLDGKDYSDAFALANQAQVDIASGYDFFTKSFFTSPGSENTYSIYNFSRWPTRNLTQFCPSNISLNQYEMIDKDNLLISSFHLDKAIDAIDNMKPNQIYSFRTQSGRYGIIKIISGAASENGFFVFDYKIQEIPKARK
jgi:hypothetical protein